MDATQGNTVQHASCDMGAWRWVLLHPRSPRARCKPERDKRDECYHDKDDRDALDVA